MSGQTFAYLRVSKLDQDLEKNKLDILNLANDAHLGHVTFIEEKISGKISWRKRQIAVILENAEAGDTIIVSELSRLGRNMLECMEILPGNPEGHLCLRRERKLATQ
jgi:DNA invertase Pin-like site-specific DNA recombinase